MKDLIKVFFDFSAKLFDGIPVLNKLKGYRSVIGFIGLAIVAVLKAQGIGDAELLQGLEYGFVGFTALSLTAKSVN